VKGKDKDKRQVEQAGQEKSIITEDEKTIMPVRQI
jgi:hypothetical protein